ncbi:MAG: hypothetical protein ACE5IM_06255, partial [Nitrospinota bacterium]
MPRVVPSQVVAVIDQLFPGAIDQLNNPGKELKLDIGASDKLTAIVDLIDKIPHELLILQADQYTNLVASIGAIRNSLAMWKARGAIGILGHMSGLRKLNPVTLIRQALVECPDEYPPEETAESSFITNDELRKNLRNDLAVTQKALSNGEWKPATVLAGSIVEALLLWKLEQRSPSDISN